MAVAGAVTLNPDYLPPSYFQNGELAVPKEKAAAFQAKIEQRLSELPEKHRSTFLSFVSLPQFANAEQLDSSTVDDVLDRFQVATVAIGSLDTLDSTGNLSRVIAKALFDTAMTQRKNELDTRLLAREVVKNAMEAQADKNRSSANEIRTGAIISLVVTVVASAISLIATGIALAKSGSAIKSTKASINNTQDAKALDKSASTMTKVTEKTEALSQAADMRSMAKSFDAKAGASAARAQSIATIGGVTNTLGQTMANATNSFTQANSKNLEADGQQIAAQAEETRKENEQAESIQKAIDDIIRVILQYLKESREIENEKMQSLTKTSS